MKKLIMCFVVCGISFFIPRYLTIRTEFFDISMFFGGMFYMWFLNKMDDLDKTEAAE